MSHRRRLPFIAALALACGADPLDPHVLDPRFEAVNGASHPALAPGAGFTASGSGFGAATPQRALLVTTSAGLRPAAVLGWSDETIVAQLPGDAVSGSIVLARGPGDTLGPIPLFVRTREPFDPASLRWRAGPDLPVALAAGQIAALRYPSGSDLASATVLMGGRAADGTLSGLGYIGSSESAGGVSAWSAAEQDSLIPSPRVLSAVAGADRTRAPFDTALFDAAVYVIGGLDPTGRPITDIIALGVESEGAYSLWTPLSPLPERRAGTAAVTAFGQLFVAGGFGADSLALSDVITGTIRPTAEISGWFAVPPLPAPRALGALVVLEDALYYIGGQSGRIDPDSTDPASPELSNAVWRVRLSPRSGFALDTVWSSAGQLVAARSRHAAFVLDGGILVTGGVYPGSSDLESEFAAVQPDGTLGPFATVTAPTIASLGGGEIRDMAYTTVWDSRGVPHPLIVGGRSGPDSTLVKVWWH